MDYIVYDGSGNILRYGTCIDSDLSLQVHATGESVLNTTYQPGSVVSGALVPLSPAAANTTRSADHKATITAVIAQKNRTALP